MGAKLITTKGTFNLVIKNYSFPLASRMKSSQVKDKRIYYPIRATQGSFAFTCKFSSREKAAVFSNLIRAHHQSAISTNSPVVRFLWEELGIDFQGTIKTVNAGSAVADFHPTYSIVMDTTRDHINHVVYGDDPNVKWEDVVKMFDSPPKEPDWTLPSSHVINTGTGMKYT